MNQALLIIDIQNDYFQGGRNPLFEPEKAMKKASTLLSLFRKEEMPIIHIQHLSIRPDASFFIPDSYGVQIHEKLKPLDKEKVFVKHFPNSFRDTGLLEHLQDQQIEKLVICGMMTHTCVDATTRAAKDFGFACCLISDACATKDLQIHQKNIKAENVHDAFMAALSYFYADVMNLEQFMEEHGTVV